MSAIVLLIISALMMAFGLLWLLRTVHEATTRQAYEAGCKFTKEYWSAEITAGCKVLGMDRADCEIEERMMEGCA